MNTQKLSFALMDVAQAMNVMSSTFDDFHKDVRGNTVILAKEQTHMIDLTRRLAVVIDEVSMLAERDGL